MCMSIGKKPTNFGNTTTGIYLPNDTDQVQFYGNTVTSASGPYRKLRRQKTTRRRGSRSSPAAYNLDELPDAYQTDDSGPKSSTGNALVMPFLTDDFDSISLIDTGACPDLLKSIKKAVQPPQSKGRGGRRRSNGRSADKVVIEEFDIYTIVRAESASAIFDAIQEVDERKRPDLNEELCAKLDDWYNCPWAVCCFDDRESGEALPIAYRYRARFPDVAVIYTMDGHDGTIPDVNATVTLDHAIFVGSYKLDESSKGKKVRYNSLRDDELTENSPERVLGTAFRKGTKMVNGDIMIPVKNIHAGRWNAYRVTPPNDTSYKPLKLADATRD